MSALRLVLSLLLFAASIHVEGRRQNRGRTYNATDSSHSRSTFSAPNRPNLTCVFGCTQRRPAHAQLKNDIFHLPMTLVGDKYYFFLNGAKTWQEGKAFCESKSLQLATFETFDDLDLVSSWLLRIMGMQETTQFWTDGTDQLNHGVWIWEKTGQPIINAWAPGEPNNAAGNEFCLSAIAGNDYYFRFYDQVCSKARAVLCESTFKFPCD